jgi:hypothetical protein
VNVRERSAVVGVVFIPLVSDFIHGFVPALSMHTLLKSLTTNSLPCFILYYLDGLYAAFYLVD